MADVELLPLPEPGMLHVGEPNEWFTADQMHAYARAHTELLRAEVERLKRHAEWLKGRDALARRFEWLRENPHVRVDQFGGKYRASTAAQILTDWLSSYDEAIDAAIAAANGSS